MAQVVFFAHKARDANELNGAIVNAHLEFTGSDPGTAPSGAGPNEMYGRNSEASATASGVSLAAG
jgi:flagella synthesis protein FlgN